jgi:hypothetical protein
VRTIRRAPGKNLGATSWRSLCWTASRPMVGPRVARNPSHHTSHDPTIDRSNPAGRAVGISPPDVIHQPPVPDGDFLLDPGLARGRLPTAGSRGRADRAAGDPDQPSRLEGDRRLRLLHGADRRHPDGRDPGPGHRIPDPDAVQGGGGDQGGRPPLRDRSQALPGQV